MDKASARVVRLLPHLATLALILWAWKRLGFFQLRAEIVTEDGGKVEMANALASVDHPFHAARFGELLESLDSGHLPRWVAEHQGGYPTDFYPFGGSLIDLMVWLLSFGQMSIPMVHTWAVALVLALPAVGFLWLSSQIGVTAWAGVVALASHLCVRGWWWSGGSHELIEWGLVTNVLAANLMFLALAGLVWSARAERWRWAPVPALLMAWGIWTNPRSLIAVGAIVLALIAVHAMRGDLVTSLRGPGLAIVCALLLATPLLAPLIRFNDLYFFVHYQGYNGLNAWLDSTVQAVSLPIFILVAIGLAVALRPGSTAPEQILALTLLAYSAATLYLVMIDWPRGFTEQLETTRLMPFQRLLMLALAGVAVGRALEWILPRYLSLGGAAFACLIPVLYVIAPPSWIPESDRGLVRIGTMASPGIHELRQSIETADDVASDSSAILILGATEFWHDHLWATLWSNRRFYYDDWLWYWQREHVGEYDPAIEHAYPQDSSAIDPEFLATHGIGAVVVTGEAEAAAAAASFLSLVRSGRSYDIYTVNGSSSLASLDGGAVTVHETDGKITVANVEAGGLLTVRQNWFPRWEATADGKSVHVAHRADGYMDIRVPAGTASVELNYAADLIDLFGRGSVVLGALLMIVFPLRSKPTVPSEPR